MVYRKIQKDQRSPAVNLVDDLQKLFQGGGDAVKFGHPCIDIKEIQRSKRTAVASHASKSGRSGVNGQELNDAETQLVDDEIQMSGKGTVLKEYDISFINKPEGFCKVPSRKEFWFVCDKTNKIYKVSYN